MADRVRHEPYEHPTGLGLGQISCQAFNAAACCIVNSDETTRLKWLRDGPAVVYADTVVTPFDAPSHVGYCHCNMCKRPTGGPFAVLVRVEKADVEWTNAPASYRPSPLAQRGFCSACGSPLYLESDDDSRIRLTIGSADFPERFPPQSHYGVESKLAWMNSGERLPEQETKETW